MKNTDRRFILFPVSDGCLEVVQFLVKGKYCKPEARAKDGETVLHYTCIHVVDQSQCVMWLPCRFCCSMVPTCVYNIELSQGSCINYDLYLFSIHSHNNYYEQCTCYYLTTRNFIDV